MMSKFSKYLALVLGVLVMSQSLEGAVTLQLEVGGLQTSAGTAVAPGTIGVLIASTTGSALPNAQDLLGATLTANQIVGSGKIIGVITVSEFDTGIYGLADTLNLAYTGGVAAGNALGIYWFPGITTAGATLTAGQSYGFFTSTTFAPGDGGNTPLVVPVDNSGTYKIAYTSASLGGSVSNSTFNATNVVSAVPEPSVSLLAMAGAMFAVFGRRRRRNRHP